MAITPKRQAFINAIIQGLNPSEAYRAAGYSCNGMSSASIANEAYKLIKNPDISPIIEERQREAAEKVDFSFFELLNRSNKAGLQASENLTDERGNYNAGAGSVVLKTTEQLLPYVEDKKAETNKFIADFALYIGKAFVDAHRSITYREHVDYWFGGGRGSLKSSFASLQVVKHIEENPDQHAVVFMKRKVEIRNAAYAQVIWAIKTLDLEDDYYITESKLQIKKKSTGQLILFRGCDKAEKSKSIKTSFGHIGIAWFEEVDQFAGMAEIRKVCQSVTRGGDDFIRLYTFNPPRSKSCWVNVEMEKRRDAGKPVYESTYLDAPQEWLGRQFFLDALDLKENDRQSYDHEYMGLPVGTGGDVFDLVNKVVFREVTDEEIAAFDNIQCGQDFGFFPDPWAFGMHEWQPGSRRIISFYEDSGFRLQPNEQAERIKEALTWSDSEGMEPEYHYLTVYSDDGRNDLISAQYSFDVDARAAGKGNMRKPSYQWLASVNWVIDPVRCPELAKEVREMQYEQNKDGEWLNTIPDKNDHHVDATRYAFMRVVRRFREAYATHEEE